MDIKAGELAFARRFVTADSVVAEIGPGHCPLAIALAAHCRQMYVIDVVDMSRPGPKASNFKHILTDGIHVSLPDRRVDEGISDQLIEHLHPDDAPDQLHELLRISAARRMLHLRHAQSPARPPRQLGSVR